jgi:hypothetical protein
MAVSVGCISLGNTQQDANQWRCYLAMPTICLPKFLKQFIIIFRAFLTVLNNRHFKFILFLLIPCTLCLVTPIAYAAQVTVSWDASVGPVSGYEIHYGTTSGDYDYSVNVGNSTSCNISGLQEGVTYFFAATAYNDIDESDYSDEIAYTIPSSSMTNYEDAEDGTVKRWRIYDNSPGGATIKNVYDNDRQSRVIQFSGSGTQNGYRLKNDSAAKWQNSNQFIIRWSMKYSEYFIVYIDVETTDGHRYLHYTPKDYDDLGNGEYVKFGIGSDTNDGKWHTYTRDLQADLEDAQPNSQILEVNGFLIRGSGKLDDIILLDQ